MTTIITTLHNGKVTAKGKGKQRTIPLNTTRSLAQNHGDAAGTLAAALGLTWSGGSAALDIPTGTAKFTI